MPVPDPTVLYPFPEQPRVILLKPLVKVPHIEIGDYTYYDDPEHAEEFVTRNVLYSYGGERLVIGKYCALATGVRFIMGGANHATSGVSTFPFTIFGGDWAGTADILAGIPSRGDTVVGNDVWIGYNVLVMPGVTIGDGAIVATGSVVTSDVLAYAVAGGNPARVVKRRFADEDVERLLRARWWDWPVELVTEHVRTIMAGEPWEVEGIAGENGLLGGGG